MTSSEQYILQRYFEKACAMQSAHSSSTSHSGEAVGSSQNTAVTVLWITADKTWVAAGMSSQDVKTVELGIGLRKIASTANTNAPVPSSTFAHHPPTPWELENAIAIVEDWVMPLHQTLPQSSALFFVKNEPASLLIQAAGHDQSRLEIDAVENIFRLFAQVVEGSPMRSSGLPDDTQFPALLLIVREFMHHLGFTSFTWLTQE